EGTKTVTYVYRELGKYIPYIPENGDPKDPNGYDPTKPGTDKPPVPYDETPEDPSNNPPLPYIPGYEPKVPGTNEPLKPVDPDDPTKGYVPPSITDPNDPGKDTPVPYVPVTPDPTPEVKKGNVVVHYVNEKGETIAKDVVDTPESDVDTPYDTTDNKPRIIEKDGKRYILVPGKTQGNETGKVTEGSTHVTYVYRELGSYIPFIPTEPGKEIPKVPYDETPEDPSNNPPLPYIPGYTPKDPNGNPLKPVDPEDPTKGYIPPSIVDPNDPAKDTPVPYEKNPDPTPQPEPKPEPQPEPKPEPQPEPKPEPQPEPKPEPKPEPQPEPKPQPRPAQPTYAEQQLPETGEDSSAALTALGIASLLGVVGLKARKRREED
ncbi:MucBP domain-containing protein, partial [Streptococcus sp. 121]|uniref:MucBP domain-containing protein n=1 Tax=Streptococcus sp. 121 TaxID=2797637 RepID=UPI0018F06E39